MEYGRAIKIDDIDLYDLGFKTMFPYEDDLTYEFEAGTISIPNKVGFFKQKDQIKGKKIKLNLQFEVLTNQGFDEKIEELTNLFFDSFGQRKKIKIEMYHWRKRHTYGYLESITKSDITSSKCTISLGLLMSDPFKYANQETITEFTFGNNDILWGNKNINFNEKYTYNHQGVNNDTAYFEIECRSGIINYPEIIIEGKAEKLAIAILGRIIKIPNFTGKWVIKRYISYLNNQEEFINGSNFYLNPGTNKIFVKGIGAEGRITIKHRERFR